MGTLKLSDRSKRNLIDVHKDLQEVVCRAIQITEVDFMVTEGLRTKERQQELFDAGASKTLNSRHLEQEDGTSHAIDICALIGGRADWSFCIYEKLAVTFKQAAQDLGVDIQWGGDWPTFKDGCHFELKRGK